MRPFHLVRSGTGPPLVLCHGFTQDATLWGAFGVLVGERRCLIQVDLPGHGGSADLHLSMEEAADALAEQLSGEPIDLLGYSLGGRLALTLAVRHPGTVRQLVLLGTTAGIEDDARRAERRARDEALADELEASGDVAGFVDRWLAQPLFAGLDPAVAGAERRAMASAAGLAASLRLMGTGAMSPVWGQLGHLDVPTLLVAGARDVRFADVARRMAVSLPNATFSLVTGAGHACHLEQPELCARIVGSWLARSGPHAMPSPSASSAPATS